MSFRYYFYRGWWFGSDWHKIDTGEPTPVRLPARRLTFHQRHEVHKLLNDILKQGVIEEACGPWSSSTVLVRKKGGSTRFCVDFHKVNNLTKKDAHLLPRIDDTLVTLGKAKWFYTLDLASHYWQVDVNPDDKPKTVFSTPFGLFQFRVMPFSLCNAPATFQWLMESVTSSALDHLFSLLGWHHHFYWNN